MERFQSHFACRFDAKGRISVPAAFRAVLAREGSETLFLHPSLDAPALDCGGRALQSEIAALIDRFPPYSPEREAFSLALEGSSQTLRLDPEGRIALGEGLKAAIEARDEAVFVGLGRKFQIWEPGRFRASLEAARRRTRDLRQAIAAQAFGAPP